MTKTTIGNVLTQQSTMRGWLVGQFFPENSPFHDNDVEIYYKTFLKGDTSDKLHFHPIGKEYLIVVSGNAIFQVGDEQFELKPGDYISINGGTRDKIVEALTDFTFVGVRRPSLPNNKVFLEE